jgi:hypothetical protein
MLTSTRGTFRHPKFEECTDRLARHVSTAPQIIDGAVWEIEHNPQSGLYVEQYDVWTIRVMLPKPFEVILIYQFNRRIVTMLTIMPAAGSPAF